MLYNQRKFIYDKNNYNYTILKWYELSHAWNEFIDINVLVLRKN